MKIPIWLIAVIVIAVGLILSNLDGCKEKQNDTIPSYKREYDSIVALVDGKDAYIKFQDSIINHRDTIIKESIKNVKTSSETAYRLNADSSYKLFCQWARQFRDSNERERYLRTDSIGLYQ